MTIEKQFLAAVEVINGLPQDGPFQPSEEVMMKFNSYYKQATIGPCNTGRPLFFDQRKKEWLAWKELGHMSKKLAMEKYIGQLLEVIETMSYTETVSNFIDMMGPFYEVVYADELTPKEGEGAEQGSSQHLEGGERQRPCETETIPKSSLENEAIPEVDESDGAVSDESFEMISPSTPPGTESFINIEELNLSHYEGEPVMFSPENFNFFIDGTESVCKMGSSIWRLSKNFPVMNESAYEILSASVLSLQKSLDNIIHHLDSLEALAKTYTCQDYTTKDDVSKSQSWNLSPFSFAIVICWPFIAHWIVHVVQQKIKY